MHFQRRNIMSNYDMSSPMAQTLVSLLERDSPQSVLTIWPVADLERLQPDAPSWPVPSIAAIGGTALGALDFAAFTPANRPRVAVQGKTFVPVLRDAWNVL